MRNHRAVINGMLLRQRTGTPRRDIPTRFGKGKTVHDRHRRRSAHGTIARIWDITLDQIATLQPTAADLLRTMAWYAPENIPTTLTDGSTDPPALNHAIGLLTATT